MFLVEWGFHPPCLFALIEVSLLLMGTHAICVCVCFLCSLVFSTSWLDGIFFVFWFLGWFGIAWTIGSTSWVLCRHLCWCLRDTWLFTARSGSLRPVEALSPLKEGPDQTDNGDHDSTHGEGRWGQWMSLWARVPHGPQTRSCEPVSLSPSWSNLVVNDSSSVAMFENSGKVDKEIIGVVVEDKIDPNVTMEARSKRCSTIGIGALSPPLALASGYAFFH